MGNTNQPSAPSPFHTRPPGNWDTLYTVVAIGANVYHPASVNPFVSGFRTSMSKKEFSTASHHILPRCCTFPVDGKRVRLELYTDNGSCSSSGSLVIDVIAKRDGIVIIYDFTFSDSFEFAKKLVQQILKWKERTSRCTPLILVGVDGGTSKARKVQYEHAQKFAEEVAIPVTEVDLESETDIERAHLVLVSLMMSRNKN